MHVSKSLEQFENDDQIRNCSQYLNSLNTFLIKNQLMCYGPSVWTKTVLIVGQWGLVKPESDAIDL